MDKLRDVTKRLEADVTATSADLRDKVKEVTWLQKELNSLKAQLTKLRSIVLNYNQSHSTNFHLEEEALGTQG